MLAQAKIFATLCWFEAQRFKAYPLEIFGAIISRFAELALYGTFWLVVSQFGQNPIPFEDMISYYLIASGLTPLFNLSFGAGAQISDAIKTGRLNQALLKPVSPLLFPWALRIGRNLIVNVFGLAQIIAGIILAGGLNPQSLPFLPLVLFNMAALNFTFNLAIGTMAFHLTDAQGFKNAFMHIAAFTRGERMPLFLMTPGLAAILSLTPFPASQYHLSVVLQGIHLPGWNDVLVGFAWSLALMPLAIWFWRRSLKKYEAIGI